MAGKTEDLKDAFSSNSINTSKWAAFGTNTLASQSNGQLVLTTSTTAGYGGLDSTGGYASTNLTGSGAFIEVKDVGNQSLTSFEVFPLIIYLDANNKLMWFIGQGSLIAFKLVATVQTSIFSTTFNSTTHRWLRIREQSGTTYFDYSSDKLNWVNATSLANPFAITAILLEITAGTYSAEVSATKATFANLSSDNIESGIYLRQGWQ